MITIIISYFNFAIVINLVNLYFITIVAFQNSVMNLLFNLLWHSFIASIKFSLLN